jgi:hypothetical protein
MVVLKVRSGWNGSGSVKEGKKIGEFVERSV